jgi:NAD(P)-dependent dehydrogenase (short-subunit alcohol dehydrogenase family)
MSVKNKFSLQGRVSIVTGGAMGLGKAMAEALAEMGSDVVIVDLNQSKAQETADAIQQAYGVRAIALAADVTIPEDGVRVADAAFNTFGKIDVLINNAGIVRHALAEEMSARDWGDVMNVNLNGVFFMAQAIGRVMIRQGGGSIINISSMSGIISNTPQNQCAYNASKAGVIALTKSLAGEWAKHGVRVNTIAPGYMKTDLTKPLFEAGGEMIKTWMKMTPMGRPGVPEELGGIAVYLASDASSFATGGVFSVDGGYTAW